MDCAGRQVCKQAHNVNTQTHKAQTQPTFEQHTHTQNTQQYKEDNTRTNTIYKQNTHNTILSVHALQGRNSGFFLTLLLGEPFSQARPQDQKSIDH